MSKIKIIVSFGLIILSMVSAQAQFSVNYDPNLQSTESMQYFSPKGDHLYVGDAIPFYHDSTYYLYWLIDSAHHSALDGLGGHQWVVSTTKDLKTWEHHPIAIGINEEWEKSICTGSVVYANNQFYAFYATRLVKDGEVNEQLSYAISQDGFNFEKQKPNPFYESAPGYSKRHFRDPKVIVDKDGAFHLLVSSEKNNAMMKDWNGALVHMVSKDLKKWEIKEPVLTGQGSVPECPDYFKWNDWYYLIYGDNGNTFYVKSKSPFGPWQQPEYQTLVEDWSNVAKTAEFINGRRIAAAWIPSRKDDKDNTHEIFGGSAVFRELIQQDNGTLSTKFPPEMIPATGQPLPLKAVTDAQTKASGTNSFAMNAPNGVGATYFDNIPKNARITLEIEPDGTHEEYGLVLRSNKQASEGYKLRFSANEKMVTLHNTSIYAVEGLNNRIKVDIIMKDGIIDVDIDNKRCIVNRLPEEKGEGFLWLFAKHGNVKFHSVKVFPILENNKLN